MHRLGTSVVFVLLFHLLQGVIPVTSQLQQPIGLEDTVTATCTTLSRLFRGQVLLHGEAGYTHAQSSYWLAQQSKLQPACRVVPNGPEDVRIILQSLAQRNVSFAVASGGHSTLTGASNINHGVTIDLSALSEVTLVDDHQAVWLGAGARWEEVYGTLEPHGLTVSGGRVAEVGVGGYVLGGGFSWFANQHGWTCDTVIEYEIVTPNREILHVSAHENEDLFWAQKGSLGAFGIVTKFKVPTIKNKAIWGGAIAYREQELPQVFAALESLNRNAHVEVASQGYLSFAWLEAEKRFNYAMYVVNTDGNQSSELVQSFQQIPHLYSGFRMMTMGDCAKEASESEFNGLRRSKFTITTKSSVEIVPVVHDIVKTAVPSLSFDHRSILGVSVQPITVPHLNAQHNIFNLSPEDGTLYMISVEAWWSDPHKDDHFELALEKMHEEMLHYFTLTGTLHPWIYPNYAARWQNPFDALRPDVKTGLKIIQERHDWEKVWSRLVPGMWTL